MVAVIVGVVLGGGGMYVAMRSAGERGDAAVVQLMELAHRMTTPEEPQVAGERARGDGEEGEQDVEDNVPLDWTDLEPTAAWTSYEVRNDVARLAPGMPLPFLGPEQQELWRQEWEKSDRGQGEASFEEWLGEQMIVDEAMPIDEFDGVDVDPWVQPRGL